MGRRIGRRRLRCLRLGLGVPAILFFGILFSAEHALLAAVPGLANPLGEWQEVLRDHPVLTGALTAIAVILAMAIVLLSWHRKQLVIAKEKFEQGQERMNLAVQAAGLGMWVWEAGSKGVKMDLTCRRICGFGTKHSMGRMEGCSGVDSPICPLLERAVEQLSPSSTQFEFECPHGKEEGKECWIATRGRGYFDGHGNLQRLIGVSMDVSERKNAAWALQQQRDLLAHVGRVSTMGQLAAAMAHDLSQPLGAILRNAEAGELLLNKPRPDLEELAAILADIRKDNQRAAAVIERIRAWLKQDEFKVESVRIEPLIDVVLSLVSSEANSKDITVKALVDQNLPAVAGGRVELEQVVLNLVLNAIDAVGTPGWPVRKVELRASVVPDGVEVCVSDTGPGITPQNFDKIFEPFFTTKENGMGMGLPICRNIVEIHGGRLIAENTPEGGATFRFTIPVERDETNGSSVDLRQGGVALARQSPVLRR